MLMQPQSPNPQFDFMLKDQPQPRRSLMPSLPKPAKIALIVVGGIILLIIVYSLLSSRGKGSSQSFIGAAARAQETLRITALAQQQNLQDPQTQALAATVSAALSSDEQQIIGYLANNHIKPSKAQLAAALDRTSDTSLQTAAQNNNLDVAYINYLRGALAHYETDLQNAYKTAGPNGRTVLAGVSESTRTLLDSPPLKA
jgi:hypothetical protein